MSGEPGLDAGEVRRQAKEVIDRARKEVEEARQAAPEGLPQGGERVVGSVEVTVPPPVTAALRARLEEGLRGIAGLRLISSGGLAAGGIRMIVFASEPLPLAAAVGRFPFVAEVTTQTVKKVIQLQVRLATPG